MFLDHDDSWLLTFMVGLIVLVFAGVGLSIAVDRRFNFSSYVSTLKRDITVGQVELERLSEIRRESLQKLEGGKPERRTAVSVRDTVSNQIANLRQRRSTLTAARDELTISIIAIEQEFLRYREKYQKTTWNAAVGQSLGTLRIRGGREYQDAVITRVTDVGMEIRHAHGTVRIQAPDFDSSVQDRFQWDDKKRQAHLGEERTVLQSLEPVPEIPKRRNRSRPEQEDARQDFNELNFLRGRVVTWKTKVAQLHSERNKALSMSYSSQKSPPGSLETWQARATRLSHELAKAQSELAFAKTSLSLVSPDDTLLKP